MKVAGRIIQTKKIQKNTETDFIANYKGHYIEISSKHNFGKSKYNHLTRFNIEVIHMDGGYVVDTWEDFNSIRDAIIFALKGAIL